MHACVHVRLPDGRIEPLVPGDVIGRTWSAALRIDDPDVSEAHAMVSLRGAELVMLSLRRRLYVDGKGQDTVVLAPGLVIRLSPETALHVVDVALPAEVLGLEGDGMAAQALPGTCSLLLAPNPRLVAGSAPDALLTFWCCGEVWRARGSDGVPFDLHAGDTIVAGGRTLRCVAIPLGDAGRDRTRADVLGAPMRIVSFYDTVHIHRGGGAPTVFSGQIARLLSELVSIGAPAPWADVAAPLWPGVEERDVLRRRWDILLVRLRERLREAGLRTDLVRSSRLGLVELVLFEGDVLDDRS
jgi:hypothetical protein